MQQSLMLKIRASQEQLWKKNMVVAATIYRWTAQQMLFQQVLITLDEPLINLCYEFIWSINEVYTPASEKLVFTSQIQRNTC